jgi:hypothetical protein
MYYSHMCSYGPQVTLSLTDANDQAPEFVSASEASVAEGAAPNSVVMAVKAVDRDEGRNGYVEYGLEPGDEQLPFTLGSVDGVLRVSGPLDRERRSNYTLRVRARDRGDPPRSSLQSIKLLVLDDNDNSPLFDPRHYSASVPENASIGASVLQVSGSPTEFAASWWLGGPGGGPLIRARAVPLGRCLLKAASDRITRGPRRLASYPPLARPPPSRSRLRLTSTPSVTATTATAATAATADPSRAAVLFFSFFLSFSLSPMSDLLYLNN